MLKSVPLMIAPLTLTLFKEHKPQSPILLVLPLLLYGESGLLRLVLLVSMVLTILALMLSSVTLLWRGVSKCEGWIRVA
jgi:hypothetical protein